MSKGQNKNAVFSASAAIAALCLLAALIGWAPSRSLSGRSFVRAVALDIDANTSANGAQGTYTAALLYQTAAAQADAGEASESTALAFGTGETVGAALAAAERTLPTGTKADYKLCDSVLLCRSAGYDVAAKYRALLAGGGTAGRLAAAVVRLDGTAADLSAEQSASEESTGTESAGTENTGAESTGKQSAGNKAAGGAAPAGSGASGGADDAATLASLPETLAQQRAAAPRLYRFDGKAAVIAVPVLPLEIVTGEIAAADATSDAATDAALTPSGSAPHMPCGDTAVLLSPGGQDTALDAQDTALLHLLQGQGADYSFAGDAAAQGEIGTQGKHDTRGSSIEDTGGSMEAAGHIVVTFDHVDAARSMERGRALLTLRARAACAEGALPRLDALEKQLAAAADALLERLGPEAVDALLGTRAAAQLAEGPKAAVPECTAAFYLWGTAEQ